LKIKSITSINNHRVKSWAQFKKGSFRNRSPLFLVEGLKECIRGIDSAFLCREVILCEDILDKALQQELFRKLDPECEVYTVSKQIYAKLAYREDTEGLIAVFEKKQNDLDALVLNKGSNYFIILENLEKPGNLGAILRTADAVKANAIILTGSGTDQYNPNVIRASLGTVFSVPVIKTQNEKVLEWAKKNNISLYSAALPAFKNFYDFEMSGSTACIFGAEDTGLTDYWIKNADITFTLPMNGIADSLNLSVSVAVVSYEFIRQQQVHKKL